MNGTHQQLPASGPEREALREKGQFWTPSWVADAMVAYALGSGASHIFDPAVGAGAFLKAAKLAGVSEGRRVELLGMEIDSTSQQQARDNGLSAEDLHHIEIGDFVQHPPRERFAAVVANPPYIRHHRLHGELKGFLRVFGTTLLGKPLDGRAGYHVYFFLQGLQVLSSGGRLAFIMPADVCEGIFAGPLWRWVLDRYRLDAVVTFAPEATPFPRVDTNAIIFMLCNEAPLENFLWARCVRSDSYALKEWIGSGFQKNVEGVSVSKRSVTEALHTGLSRPPSQRTDDFATLRDFAYVLRGIATGANEFFFLTEERAAELGLPPGALIPAVGRTRDVRGDLLTDGTMQSLRAKGRPTLLLSLNAASTESLPRSVRDYLGYGAQLGLPRRALIATRNPWYRMESRVPPPFLFAYLGRRSARFIRNVAGVVPLTGFLCVYPRVSDAKYIEKLWGVLRDPETIAELPLVAKSYGSGAIKVEPRSLERLAIPTPVLQRHGINLKDTPGQLQLIAS
ncbi:MAG TPA: N-6 DNA methylase [Candidatus Acidoferrales bacterium]|nr:N-6 DNA methylase [Candidatus Acidoferrales bacterium]